VQGYFLIQAKNGTKLRDASDLVIDRTARDRMKDAGLAPFPMASGTLTQLALFLSSQLRCPVVERTNLPGKFDFTPLDGTEIVYLSLLAVNTQPSYGPPAGSIFSTLKEKLGLELEPQKIPVEIFVVDHAEKPEPGQNR
jgi:uncharacterized protein (TIGR03435 family)